MCMCVCVNKDIIWVDQNQNMHFTILQKKKKLEKNEHIIIQKYSRSHHLLQWGCGRERQAQRPETRARPW